jgi:tRNA (Thr-GGU) A37 N-methylase
MLDGTPILDLKPYLSSVPAEELRRGWLDDLFGKVDHDPSYEERHTR